MITPGNIFLRGSVIVFLFFFSFTRPCLSQKDNPFKVDSLPLYDPAKGTEFGLKLPVRWKYCKGDNIHWADTSFNDSSWPHIPTRLYLEHLNKDIFSKIGWFRIWIVLDPAFENIPLALMIDQWGASDIYIDGRLVQSVGKVDTTGNETRYGPKFVPIPVTFYGHKPHLIALRYSNSVAWKNYTEMDQMEAGFRMKLGQLKDSVFSTYVASLAQSGFFIFYFSFFIAIGFVHLMLYLFYRINRSNLYYSIFCFGFGFFFLFNIIRSLFFNPDFIIKINYAVEYLPFVYILGLLAMLYSILSKDNKLPKLFWIIAGFFVLIVIMSLLGLDTSFAGIIMNIILIIEPIRIVVAAIIKKRDGAWIIGIGIISTVSFFTVFFMLPFFREGRFAAGGDVGSFIWAMLVVYFTLNIPLSMSIFLARDFSKTNKKLQAKLIEVEELSARNLEQQKEKQRILETQNQYLEERVIERTKEITEQKKIIEEKNKDITDSITYARRIQMAQLPSEKLIRKLLDRFR